MNGYLGKYAGMKQVRFLGDDQKIDSIVAMFGKVRDVFGDVFDADSWPDLPRFIDDYQRIGLLRRSSLHLLAFFVHLRADCIRAYRPAWFLKAGYRTRKWFDMMFERPTQPVGWVSPG